MNTQAELLSRLRQFGIVRNRRVLTDWKNKGLLPRLQVHSHGRDRGVTWYWDEDVLDQAIAVHCQLKRYSRSDAAVLVLWVSGYSIDPEKIRAAWLRLLNAELKRMKRAAKHLDDNYSMMARRVLREFLGGRKRIPSPHSLVTELIVGADDNGNGTDLRYRKRVADVVCDWFGLKNNESERDEKTFRSAIEVFTGGAIGWAAGDSETDDEDFRGIMAETLAGVEQHKYEYVLPGDELMKTMEGFWEKTGFPEIFRTETSIPFVRSMSISEMCAANSMLKLIRFSVRHGIRLLFPSINQVECTTKELQIMDGVGPFVASVVISVGRNYPDWPLTESIVALHDFAKSVKLDDLNKKKNKGALLSRRAHRKWQTATQQLSQLWDPVMPARREKQRQ